MADQDTHLDARRLLEIERELWRRQCRDDYTSWCIEAMRDQGHVPATHHRVLISALEKVMRGECTRLLITMPPGSAKTTYSTLLLPPFFFAQKPRRRILCTSATEDFAMLFSRKVQRLIVDNEKTLGYSLASEAAAQWTTTNDCEYKAAGVGGQVIGLRADGVIIDDPFPSRKEADQAGYREEVWKWYLGSIIGRLTPGGFVLLIMTRWHEDDLAGRLKMAQPGLWTELKLPAIAGEDDPLGRQPGEMLWSDDAYGYGADLREKIDQLEQSGAVREIAAQYQQDPRPDTGGIFMPDNIVVVDALDPEPRGHTVAPFNEITPLWAHRITDCVRAWDLAATAQVGTSDPDWTVGLKMARLSCRKFAILDVVRFRGRPEQVEQRIVETAQADGKSVRIRISQDPGQAGKAQTGYFAASLAGFNVKFERETGDKATRAAPVASQINAGNVLALNRDWLRPLLAEMRIFPAGAKDDQVDALSSAFAELAAVGVASRQVAIKTTR